MASQRCRVGKLQPHSGCWVLLTIISREDLAKRIMLKTTGPAGEYERAANAHELTAIDSVFATALRDNASTQELQTMADKLSRQGCLATNPHAATALKTLVHYMRTLQLCTARFLPNIERLRRGYYDFDVQICCIELAIQLKAEQFGQCVVREVVRESFFLRLNLRQWRAVADKLRGMLDPFLVIWAAGLDDTYITHRENKIACLKPALEVLPAIRSVYAKAFREDPGYLRSNRTRASPNVASSILDTDET